MLNINAKLWTKVGLIYLNKEHKYNMLTPRFNRDVLRHTESFVRDYESKVVYMTA
jgi:enoyl-CoA hydratase/carnithine racemase